MTSLQGVMGGHYALRNGEPEAVAAAIAEQYEAVSRSGPGLALALADRLDSLTGLTAVGLAPKGSNDPFALRRAAIQIVENLIANERSFDLREALAAAAGVQAVKADAKVQRDVLAFITGRLEVVLRERGLPTHVVRAVLAAQAHDPFSAGRAAEALAEATKDEDWEKLLDAYARSVRITRKQDTRFGLRPEALVEPAEQELYRAYEEAVTRLNGTVGSFVAALRQMEPAITRFFDEILVMAEDVTVRENRLALLQHIAALAKGIADLTELEGF
jgi:glycyl-tRNA synthetase